MKPARNQSAESESNSNEFPRLSGTGRERRRHHRHDLETQAINVERWDAHRNSTLPLGKIVDISAGGVRFRTTQKGLRRDQQIRVRLELPSYAGISPFISPSESGLEPRADWVGWITVSRVEQAGDNEVEVGCRLADMDDMARGMFGLYLSTQPLAA